MLTVFSNGNEPGLPDAAVARTSWKERRAQAALTGPFGDISLSVLSHDPQKVPE
jgi:hypothetical protein